jgi:hypothetical protein
MALSRSGKIRIALAVLAIVLAVAAWQGLSLAVHRGYAHGTATGVVRKVSVHGPPYCKFLTGELVYQGGQSAQKQELFDFSIDDYGDANPVVGQLREAERAGTRVTLHFRQDVKPWWRCNPSEYFITAVEK